MFFCKIEDTFVPRFFSFFLFFFLLHALSSNYSFQLDGTLVVTRFDDPIPKCKATFARVNIDLFILHLSRFAKINYKCGQSTLSSNM